MRSLDLLDEVLKFVKNVLEEIKLFLMREKIKIYTIESGDGIQKILWFSHRPSQSLHAVSHWLKAEWKTA